jgi:uncharacterized membrane protein
MARYFAPAYLGINLSLAYLFARKIQLWHRDNLTTKLWKLCFVTILIGGIISSTVSSQAESWWNKRSWDQVMAAKIINKSSQSLLIMNTYVPDVLSITYKINPDVKFQFIKKNQDIPTVPDKFNNIFLLQSSNFPVNKYRQEQQFKIQLLYKGRKQNL